MENNNLVITCFLYVDLDPVGGILDGLTHRSQRVFRSVSRCTAMGDDCDIVLKTNAFKSPYSDECCGDQAEHAAGDQTFACDLNPAAGVR